MDKKKLKLLITSITIMTCGALAFIAFFVPYFRYEVHVQSGKNPERVLECWNYFLFEKNLGVDVTTHFKFFQSRKWLMGVFNVMIVWGCICLVAAIALGILEALCYKKSLKPILKPYIKWAGLGILILGGIFFLLSITFFLFSNNFYKVYNPITAYTEKSFKGQIGWWLMNICTMLGGALAFTRGLDKTA